MERRVLCGLVLAALLLVPAGCASWRGAKLYQSGSEALDRGDVELAISDLQRAARLVPDASQVQNHLGLAYTAAGREQDAIAAFEEAVDLDCENDAAGRNLVAARRARFLGEHAGASTGDRAD
jgi:tetratricopeptide (TPR) repeat protein